MVSKANKSEPDERCSRRHASIIAYRLAISLFPPRHSSRHCELSRNVEHQHPVKGFVRFNAFGENKFILRLQTLSFHRHPVIQVKIYTRTLRLHSCKNSYLRVRASVSLVHQGIRRKSIRSAIVTFSPIIFSKQALVERIRFCIKRRSSCASLWYFKENKLWKISYHHW